eukprot:TRINITY_DN2421_c0_g3_i2.p1 TRINITY_DN2421_c0_g3~~TRINITY_DN2421_c0_g3_i2.p1  ORF type:complete len:443 (+),score=38.86 TRINITY_DN2421_c0_g3_i2:99-1427(+)
MSISAGGLIWAAVQPVLKIALLSIVGVILGRKGIIDRKGESLLGQLIVKVFLPSLMIAKLGSTLSWSNLLQWWPSMLNVLLTVVVGGFLGWMLAVASKVPYNFRGHTIAACGLGNVGSIPLIFAPEVVKNAKDIFGEPDETLAIAYTVLGLWVVVIGIFSWANKLIPVKQDNTQQQQQQQHGNFAGENRTQDCRVLEIEMQQVETGESIPYCVSTESMLEDKENDEKDFRQQFSKLNSGSSMVSHEDSSRQTPNDLGVRYLNLIGAFIKNQILVYINAPVLATVAALVIGIIPPVQKILFDEGAPLQIVGSTFDTLGDATIPSMMILLGATLSSGPTQANVSIRTVVGLCITRLILVPVIGTLLLYFAFKGKWIDMPDRVFALVLLSQWLVPTAINLQSLAAIKNNGVLELSVILFWQYIFAIFTMPAFGFLFLVIIEQVQF